MPNSLFTQNIYNFPLVKWIAIRRLRIWSWYFLSTQRHHQSWHLLDHEPEVGLETGHWQPSWTRKINIFLVPQSLFSQGGERWFWKLWKVLNLVQTSCSSQFYKTSLLLFTTAVAQQWTLDFTQFVTHRHVDLIGKK